MNKNLDEFLKLAKMINDFPELPVYCLVEEDVVSWELGGWVGRIGKSEFSVCAYYNGELFFDRDEFKEEYYGVNGASLDSEFGFSWFIANRDDDDGISKEEIEANEASEKKLNEYLDKIADEYFKNAIIVHIDLPIEAGE